MMAVEWAQGRTAEAANEARRAWERDTLSVVAGMFYAVNLYGARDYDDLEAFLPHLRSSAPESEVRGMEGLLSLGRGDCVAAGPLLAQARKIEARMSLIPALVCAGERERARERLDSLLAERRARYVPASIVAMAYYSLGDKDRAFEWLERAHDERDAFAFFLLTAPYFDLLRGDARFEALLRRIRLPPRS